MCRVWHRGGRSCGSLLTLGLAEQGCLAHRREVRQVLSPSAGAFSRPHSRPIPNSDGTRICTGNPLTSGPLSCTLGLARKWLCEAAVRCCVFVRIDIMPVTGWTKRLLILACTLFACACVTGDRLPSCDGKVVKVTYHDWSGPIADPYSEDYAISTSGIRFERTGEPQGPINRGVWEFTGDAARTAALFAALGAIDTSQIEVERSEGSPPGYGSKSYRIEFDDGCEVELFYDGGTFYTGAEPVRTAIDAYIAAVKLPEEAHDLER